MLSFINSLSSILFYSIKLKNNDRLTISCLPNEIIEKIIENVGISSIRNLPQVSKQFNCFFSGDHVFRHFWKQESPRVIYKSHYKKVIRALEKVDRVTENHPLFHHLSLHLGPMKVLNLLCSKGIKTFKRNVTILGREDSRKVVFQMKIIIKDSLNQSLLGYSNSSKLFQGILADPKAKPIISFDSFIGYLARFLSGNSHCGLFCEGREINSGALCFDESPIT